MPRTITFLLMVFYILFCSGCANFSNEKSSSANSIIGVYPGEILSGVERCDAETNFFINSEGKISGTYWFVMDGKKYDGELKNCSWKTKDEIQCQWYDVGGDGILAAIFSNNFSEFIGWWAKFDYQLNNIPEANVPPMWSGKREK